MTFSDAVSELMANARNPYKMATRACRSYSEPWVICQMNGP
jgi:hypothetical protein